MLNLLERLPLPRRLSEQPRQQPSARPREKMPTIYRHKITELASLNEAASKHYRETGRTHHLKDLSMTIDRAEMLLKTGMTSRDNPEWIGQTSCHYRQEKTPCKNRIASNTYDILNNPKQIVSGRNEDYYYSLMSTSSVVPKEQMRRSTLNWTMSQQREVTDKVGSLDRRDYTIPRPLLKIGREGSFVDTYSAF